MPLVNVSQLVYVFLSPFGFECGMYDLTVLVPDPPFFLFCYAYCSFPENLLLHNLYSVSEHRNQFIHVTYMYDETNIVLS